MKWLLNAITAPRLSWWDVPAVFLATKIVEVVAPGWAICAGVAVCALWMAAGVAINRASA